MFQRRPILGLRAFVLVLLGVLLIILDHSSTWVHRLRNEAGILVVPIQYVVDTPIKLWQWAATSFSSQQKIINDDAKLRAHEFLLEAKLQKLLELELENAQLRELLQSQPQISGKEVVGQLLAVALDPTRQLAVVDLGANKGIYNGQPVLDAYGVMGQVIEVGPVTSKVLLITDTRSAVPVEDARNGLRAIALGAGLSGKLMLINVTDTKDIKVGDKLVTSGFGLRYPIGYPVGEVVYVGHRSDERFATILVTPAAHLNHSQQVLMVWPEKADLQQAVAKQLANDELASVNHG